MRILTIVLFAAACVPDADLSQRPPPPPGTLQLTPSMFYPGQQARLLVDGLDPFETAHFVRADRAGSGLCPPAAAGVCLDITGGMVYLGSRAADASGTASYVLTVPLTAPVGASTWFQSLALRPTGAIKSPPVEVQLVGPDDTADTALPAPDLCVESQAIFDASCIGCHGDGGFAGLDLRDASTIVGQPSTGSPLSLVDPAGSLQSSYLWHKLQDTASSVGGSGGQMPPGGVLDPLAMAAVQDWISAGGGCTPSTDTGEPPPPDPVPGVGVLHRLNRAEYDNTVRDLLSTQLQPALNFPLDDAIAGFDNIAAGLSVSTLHLEMYEAAAEALADDFVRRYDVGGPPQNAVDALIEAETLQGTAGGVNGSFWGLYSVGEVVATVTVPYQGSYDLSVAAYARQGGPDLARMQVKVDGVVVSEIEVPNTDRNAPVPYSVSVTLEPGEHTIAARFINDFYDPVLGLDRNLYVDWLHLVGPTDTPRGGTPGDSPFGLGISCNPAMLGDTVCLSLLLPPMMERAFRRPVPSAEAGRLIALASSVIDGGGSYRDGVVAAVQGMLLSPSFLYRPELDHNGPTDSTPQALGDYELASRLSYFLWSSMPDDQLFSLAAAGQLQNPAVLDGEVRRLLADARAAALVDNFAGQWLWLRRIVDGKPDPLLYPDVDDALRADFAEQARRLVSSFLTGSRSMSELLTTTTAEISPDLAVFYGYPDTLTGWTEVDLADQERHGILTNAGLLAALSNPTTSNPVRRGKFLLEQVLCDSPGDPPAGVTGSFDPTSGPGSLRDQFEAHRSDPSCSVCHQVLDPLGFSLEGYGPAGELRVLDDLGYPIDTVGVMPDGRTFDGPEGLGQTLGDDPLFPLCVSEQLFTYALGQPPEPHTWPYVLDARDAFVAEGLTFEELAVAIVTSDAFRMRGE